jgi:hypothetical protein
MPRRPLHRVLSRLVRSLPGEWGRRRRPAPLIDCPARGSARACIVDSEEEDETHGWIRLRCAECEMWRDVVATDEEANELDHALMAAEVDVLVAALEHDVIDASSFAL